MRGWLALVLLGTAGCAALAGLDEEYVVGPATGDDTTTTATGSATGTASTTGTAGSGGGTAGSSSIGGGGIGGTGSGLGGTGGTGGDPGPECGNDHHEPPGEECDDGNNDHLDGCSATCTIEDPDSCSAAPIIELALSQTEVVTGDTTGASDDITTSTNTSECGAGTRIGPDHVWIVVPQSNGSLTVSLDATFTYHFLHMRDACPGTTDLGCDYSSTASTVDDFVVSVVQGTTYWIIVDSWGTDTVGPYTLTVSLN
ncbi:MAG: hypothetical protein JRI23_26645 [Deltaproteobacteria bacterium]|jgi:cysteine-rich repeat protein|nr:hypothetical protein [Deltaproteobacteria bacterium]MBW2535625.1 hypothetical protein [Deltaproteobacteria bacterium]